MGKSSKRKLRGRRSSARCGRPARRSGILRLEALEERHLLATASLSPVKDNSLFEDQAGSLSNGAGEFLYAGETRSFGSRRAVLAFDLAAAGIPAGSTLTDVQLSLFVSKAALNTTSTQEFAIHKVTSDWGEGSSNAGSPGGRGTAAAQNDATWLHTFFSGSQWNSAGGDFEATASAMANAGGNGTTATWSSQTMIADVQRWVDDASTNFGWIMIGDESTRPNARRFNSKEHFNPSTRPKLEITYEAAPAESLSLTISDASISELDGSTTATVSRTGSSGNQVVDLMSDDTTEATVVASVEIADGQTTSPEFQITGVDDALLDGTQTVTITATAPGATSGSATVDVTDFENLSLAISDASISEDDGATTATVTRTDPSGVLTISLTSDDPSEATVVGSVVIPDGETVSPAFAIDAVDDALLDGTQTVTVSASAPGYVSASAGVDVTDSEALALSILDAAISENGGSTTGTVTRTDTSSELTVDLLSDDTTAATVVASVTIESGQASGDFTINAVDDSVLDGTQTVAILASAAGYEPATAQLDVTDFEPLTVTTAVNSISESGGSAIATVTRTDSSGELLVTLSSSDTSEATVPESVTIPDGVTVVNFTITSVDDEIGDADRTVNIGAAAAGYVAGSTSIDVTDDEVSLVLTPAKDNSLFEHSTGPRSSGTGEALFVGVNGNDDIRRALLAFDLVNSGLPAGSTILNASLEVSVTRSSPGSGPSPTSVHRLTQDWGEGASGAGQSGGGSGSPAEIGDATWEHTFFDTSLWNTPGGDFEPTPSATAQLGVAPSQASWSSDALVADLQTWLRDPASNFGWILIGDESTFSTSKRLTSRETTTGIAPRLVLGYEAPTEQLTLTFASAGVPENGGVVQGTVTRSGDTSEAVRVFLSSNDVGEAGVPAEVTIPAGVDSASFDVTGVDDDLLDGVQTVTIDVVATGFTPATGSIDVTDFEQLTVAIDASAISELGAGTAVTVSRTDPAGALIVNLSSSDTSEATVPATVTILDGELSASVALAAVDDVEQDGTQTVIVSASATGYVTGEQSIDVIDDETASPTTALVQDGVLTVRGGDRDDNLTFRVDGSDLVILDPANLISNGSGNASNEATVPIGSFTNGIVVETASGSNSLTLDASIDGVLAGNLEFRGGTGDDVLVLEGAGLSLDLTQLIGVERVDLAGQGGNALTLGLSSVEQNLDSSTGRFVLVSDLDDSVDIGDGWSLTDTAFVGEFFRVLTQGSASLFLSGPADWQNPIDRLDVSNDGVVSPVGDVLPLINEVNNPQIIDQANGFPEPTPEQFPSPFMDVNGDGSLTPVGDILTLINFLNSGANAEGEGVSMPIWLPVDNNTADPDANDGVPFGDEFALPLTSVVTGRVATRSEAVSVRPVDEALLELLAEDDASSLDAVDRCS